MRIYTVSVLSRHFEMLPTEVKVTIGKTAETVDIFGDECTLVGGADMVWVLITVGIIIQSLAGGDMDQIRYSIITGDE